MSQWKVQPEVSHYFITTTVTEWQCVFTSIPYFEILIETLEFCIDNKGLHLHGFVIMPNHAHYIVSTHEGRNLSDIMRDFNTHSSREITNLLKSESRLQVLETFREAAREAGRGNEFKLWQDGFHPIGIVTEKFFKQKLNYLHDNPVRKGYVERPECWVYSSARNYMSGDHSIIQVECLL